MADNSKDPKVHMSNRFLTFFIEAEQYGLDISFIKEIISLMGITEIPKTPNYVKGVINLRGTIIPVIDIRLKFGLEAIEPTVDTSIVIYEIDHVSIGFIVDRVEDVVTIDKKKISGAPDFGGSIDTTFISGVAETAEGVIMILDLKNIFDHNELTLVGQMEKKQNKEEVEEELS